MGSQALSACPGETRAGPALLGPALVAEHPPVISV